MAATNPQKNKEIVEQYVIETSQAIQNLKALQKELNSMKANVPSKQFNKLANDIRTTISVVSIAQKKLEDTLTSSGSNITVSLRKRMHVITQDAKKAAKKITSEVKAVQKAAAKTPKQTIIKPADTKKDTSKSDKIAQQNEKLAEQKKVIAQLTSTVNKLTKELDKAKAAQEKLSKAPMTEWQKFYKQQNAQIQEFNQRIKVNKYQNDPRFQQFQKTGSVEVFSDTSAEEQVTQVDMVSKALDGLGSALGRIKTQSETVNEGLKTLGAGFETVGGIILASTGHVEALAAAIPAAIKASLGPINLAIGAVKDLHTIVKKFSTDTQNDMLKAAQSVKQFIKLLATGFAGTVVGKSVNSMVEMAEAENLFTVAMKQNVIEGRKFISLAKVHYGLDPVALQETIGIFYEMANAVDIPGEAASKLSQDMTALSLHVASLFNVDFEKVTENMQSGIRGMSRAVVQYGVDIRAATIEQFAASELGITQQFETMSEANRELLRYLVIVKQTTDATGAFAKASEQAADATDDFNRSNKEQLRGDLARTLEQPANQLRVLKEQFTVLGRNISTVFLPMVQAVVPVINGVLMAVNMLVESFARLFSLITTTDTYDKVENGFGGIGSSIDDAAKKAKDFLAPFDELHVLAEDMANTGADVGLGFGEIDPRILDALNKVDIGLEHVYTRAHEVRDAILEWLGLDYNPELDPATGEWKKYFDVIEGGFADLISEAWGEGNFKEVGVLLNQQLDKGLEKFADKSWWDTKKQEILDKLDVVLQICDGFFSDPKLFLDVGYTLSNALATGLELLDYSLVKFNWTQLGQRIADTMGAFFANPETNWLATAASAFAHALNALADAALGFADEFPWDEVAANLAEAAKTFFQEWESDKLGDAAFEVMDKFLGMMEDAIAQMKADGTLDLIASRIASFFEHLKWSELLAHLGSVIWAGLKDAVIAAVKGIIVSTGEKAQNNLAKVTGLPVGTTDFNNSLGLKDLLNPGSFVGKATGQLADQTGVKDKIDQATSFVLNGATSFNQAGSLRGKNSDTINNWSKPKMAFGGVVTGPTSALIGEAGRAEAVIPLEDAPQMKDLVDKIASAVSSTGSKETVVKVYIGDKEWDAFTYQSAERGKRIIGSQPIRATSFA